MISLRVVSLRVLAHAYRAWRRNRRWAKHEPETPYLADLLSGAPVCLHVGASDGRHAYVMTQVAPRARIHAFEPSAFTLNVLRTCLAWHGVAAQVTPVRAGVADAPGQMLLITPRKTNGRLGWSLSFLADSAPVGRVRPDLEDAGMVVHRAPVITLDAYCRAAGLERVDFLRIDVEGAEARVLKGAQGLIDRDRPHVLIEIHPLMLKERFGSSAEAVVGFFAERGYRMFALRGGRLVETQAVASDAPWKDYFFVHPSRAPDLPDGIFKARMAV